MDSGEAHGWLIVDLFNTHLHLDVPDRWDTRHRLERGLEPDYVSSYCPDCCGPCGALRDYFDTARGRAEAQVYLSCLSKESRQWSWSPGGVIDWDVIGQWMKLGWCPNHEE